MHIVAVGRRAWVAVALGIVLAVVVAGPASGAVQGLGGGADDPLAPDLRAWLDDHGPLRIGWTDFVGPTSVQQDGEVTGGYGVDLWDLAALKLGIEVEHVVIGTPAEVVEALAAGEVDVAGAFAERPDLVQLATAVEPFAWVETGFVTSPDQVDRFQQGAFVDATVTTITGSPHVVTLDEQFPDLTYVETDGLVPGLRQVADGHIDLYLGPFGLLGFALRDTTVDLRPVGPVVAVEPVGPYALPDTPQLEIARAARGQLTDAEVELTNVRWTGFDLADPDAADVPAWVLPAILGLAGGLGVVALFAWVLRRRVRAATAELHEVNADLEGLVEERTASLLVREEQLERSNAALQRFASVAAHDLKGPLAAMVGLADIALRMDLERAQEQDLVRRVRNSAASLGQMVDDMLEDALSMGAGIDALRGPDFVDWLREVSAPELDVIDGELVAVAPDRVIDADVEVLRRAAINLVGNAVKYAVNEEGVVVRVALRRLAEVWELQVDDNGPGVPKDQWAEVFDRGRRLTHDDRGFGLGLAAIRDLVQGGGGSIRIGDADLGGARFTVTLPVRPEAPAAAAHEPAVARSADAGG